MTQPHPQERCGHFEVCLTVHSRRLHPGICPFDERPQNSKTGKCKHDTRPHTPAAPATEYTIEQIAEIDNRIRKERKAGREQALDELTEFANSMSFLNVPILKGVLLHKIKSLRGGATDEGGDRRE